MSPNRAVCLPPALADEVEALRADPGFAEAFAALARASLDDALTPKLRALILVAINGAVTHLREVPLRAAVRDAQRHGASVGEVREVLQLASVLGVHALSIGIPALLDESAAAGSPLTGVAPLGEEQRRLKDEFTAARGRWSDRWEALLRLAPDYFAAYTKFSAHPWRTGTLSPKEREFIYIAIDCSTTHLFEPGLRVHVRNALVHGATAAEVLAVLKLCSLMGVQTQLLGERVLAEEYGAEACSL